MGNEKELLEEVFFIGDVPESLDDLDISGLFDVVHTIEKKGYYFMLENKPGYGHYATFLDSNSTEIAGGQDFVEFRMEAITDAIRNFIEWVKIINYE